MRTSGSRRFLTLRVRKSLAHMDCTTFHGLVIISIIYTIILCVFLIMGLAAEYK